MLFKSRIRRNIEKMIAELQTEIADYEDQKFKYEKNPKVYANIWYLQLDCQKKVDMLKELL